MLNGIHQDLYQMLHSVYAHLNLDNDVIPSNAIVISNLKTYYHSVCDYVWENIDDYLTCLARECSREYHGLESDDFDEYMEAQSRTIAVLYDSQCQIQSQSN